MSQHIPEKSTHVPEDTSTPRISKQIPEHTYVCHSRYQSTLSVPQQIPEHTKRVTADTRAQSMPVTADNNSTIYVSQQIPEHITRHNSTYQSTLRVSEEIPEHSPHVSLADTGAQYMFVTADTRAHYTCHSRYQSTLMFVTADTRATLSVFTADKRAQYTCNNRHQNTVHACHCRYNSTVYVSQQIPEHSTCIIADTIQQ